ncbi:MAG: metallophosphoesterase [Armatimonadetes bacterium]|nr:metallophosphoesterase [Armatimonadota bacterium]
MLRPANLLLALCLSWNAAAVTVTGRVTLDQNNDGRAEATEPPVVGALVSDEHSLVRTAADGTYRLEADGVGSIFVVNPPGTWPAGPWWARPGTGPTATVDFALREQPQTETFLFVHGTDMHTHPPAAAAYARYLDHVNNLPLPPVFVVHTGDLIRDGNAQTPEQAGAAFDDYLSASAALRAPRRDLMGNHEVVGVANSTVPETAPGFGKALFRQKVGPASYAFRYGRTHFVALDGTSLQGRTLRYALTPESAAWAAAYLALVPSDEGVVILIHEPLGIGPGESTLLAALQGKRLLGTLCGHGHERVITRWGDAPQVMGGAVSYAWHGMQPFPPQPYGYVVWRVAPEGLEWVFVDWAEERSIDLMAPLPALLLTSQVTLRGAVNDFTGDITAVHAQLAGRQVEALCTRRKLATAFEATLDTGGLQDGVYDLALTAFAGERSFTEKEPVVVVNGLPAPFTPSGPATLTFQVDGVAGPDNQVLVNGQPLATIPATPARQQLTFEVPATYLRRLNEVVFRGVERDGGRDKLRFSLIALTYEGRRHRDVRFAINNPRTLLTKPEHVAYVDLAYTGPRGLMP